MKEKKRTAMEKKNLTTRLKKIEGQVRGVSKMIEEDRYCEEILTQIAAIQKALKSVGNEVLKIHMHTCVVENIKSDHLEIIEEVMNIIKRFD